MAEQDRRNQSGKGKPPITRHPLFPATVALWFGALFGFGSLAIRPTLLESIVLAAHLDTLIPAAAPPLGMTSRILVALVLSGIGGLIGAAIAHRIAAPRPEHRERRRGANVVSGRGAGNSYAAEGRRRPLTSGMDYAPRDFDEHAPLPGGSPQILNVSDFDFADEPGSPRPAIAGPDGAEPYPAAAQDAVEVRLVGGRSAEDSPVVAPLDLDAFAQEDAMPTPLPEAHVSLSRHTAPDDQAHQFAPTGRFAAPQTGDSFGAVARDRDAGTQSALPERFDNLAQSAPPLFGTRTAAAQSEAPAPSVQTPPFSQPAPLVQPAPFAQPAPAVQSAPFAQPAPFAPAAPVAQPVSPVVPAETDEPVVIAAPQPVEPVVAPAPARPEAPAAFTPPVGPAAERVATADLARLSPVELIERLALSLQARRERAAIQPGPVAAPIELHQPAAAPAPTPAASEAAPAAPLAMPVAAPVGAYQRLAPATVSFEGSAIVPPPVGIPAALRPVGFDVDDDIESMPSYVPQRQISMNAAAPAQAPTPVAVEDDIAPADFAPPAYTPTAFTPPAFTPPAFSMPQLPLTDEADEPAATAPEESDSEDSQALEDGYSSLLDLTRRAQPRQAFVRIEEPEAEDAPVEPVVVFPGQANRTAPAFAAPQPVAAPAPAGTAARPFDAPAATPAAAAVRAAAAPAQNPEETERALRSALASLQRMSGAA